MYTPTEYELTVLAPLSDDVGVEEWVDMYLTACGYTEERYQLVPLSEVEPYMYAIQLLRENDLVLSVDEVAMIVEMNPDRDPSIINGEACLPQALRVVRIIPLH